MPRTARASQSGYCYHVLSRGNDRETVFHQDGDFYPSAKLLRDAGQRVPMRLLAYCLMPNHFHLEEQRQPLQLPCGQPPGQFQFTVSDAEAQAEDP